MNDDNLVGLNNVALTDGAELASELVTEIAAAKSAAENGAAESESAESEHCVAAVDEGFDRQLLKGVVEGLLMASSEPLRIDDLLQILNAPAPSRVILKAEVTGQSLLVGDQAPTSPNVDSHDSALDADSPVAAPVAGEISPVGSVVSDSSSISELESAPEPLFHTLSENAPENQVKKYSFKINEIESVVRELMLDYAGRAIELVEVASGFRFQVRSDFAPWIAKMHAEKPPRYSRAFMETLALIAYKQPITRAEIEEVRGVSVSSNIIKTLMECEWIKLVGYKDVPGKPGLYGTTEKFLDYFNIKSLAELPALVMVETADVP